MKYVYKILYRSFHSRNSWYRWHGNRSVLMSVVKTWRLYSTAYASEMGGRTWKNDVTGNRLGCVRRMAGGESATRFVLSETAQETHEIKSSNSFHQASTTTARQQLKSQMCIRGLKRMTKVGEGGRECYRYAANYCSTTLELKSQRTAGFVRTIGTAQFNSPLNNTNLRKKNFYNAQ
jgi:hypothetical protein